MASLPQIATALQTALTDSADDLARTSGFCQRRSKLTAAVFVQTLVLGWWQHPAATLHQLCQMAAVRGVPVSPQGLDQRFTEAGATLLKACLDAVVAPVLTARPVADGLLARFAAVYVLDSTTITLPDCLATLWPGGRVATNTQAALKGTVRIDLRRGCLAGLELTPGRTQDRATNLQHAPVPKGAIRIADQGFWSLPVFRAITAGGGYFLSRYHAQTSVWHTGTRLDLPRWLAAQATPVIDVAVTLGKAERLPARLLALRVPQAVADQRRRRLRASARAGGHAVPQTTLALVDWTLLVTNAPADRLSIDEAEVLRRLRWQIELLFKLWKSHGHVDASRSANPWRILCEVYAKLLAVVLQHGVLLVGGGTSPDRTLVQAAATIRDHVLRLALALDRSRQITRVLRDLISLLAAIPAPNKRRKRPSAAQLLADPTLVHVYA
jgi:Transposase DDE domain